MSSFYVAPSSCRHIYILHANLLPQHVVADYSERFLCIGWIDDREPLIDRSEESAAGSDRIVESVTVAVEKILKFY